MESTKEAGNKAFKANNLEAAVKSWREALAVDRTNKSFNSKLHCNLAAAYAKVIWTRLVVTCSSSHELSWNFPQDFYFPASFCP